MIAEPIQAPAEVDVDPRDLYAAFEAHYRRCMPCATAPTGLLLCPIGADLFDAALGRVGLDPTQADANAMTPDLSDLSLPRIDRDLFAHMVDDVWPWADVDDLERWRAARRIRAVNGKVRAGVYTEWPQA